jgi:hypothetical protein
VDKVHIRSAWGLAVIFGVATPALAQERIQDDPRVRAFLEAYRPYIDSVSYHDGDIVFSMGGRAIHFEDGRLLDSTRLDRRGSCDPLFYRYPLEPLTEPPEVAEEFPMSCRDAIESLWGSTETEVRRHTGGVRFLNRRMIVNDILIEPLAAVEQDLAELGTRDVAVADWIRAIQITYSFIFRDISATDTGSYHAWGLAFDLVPTSYDGKHVYWRWSRAMDRQGWQSIPIGDRWSPPDAAIEVFERHGFVWGGKWGYFDMIHFEYRPEILIYNRLLEGRQER